MNNFLGIDTSNYTTSTAFFDAQAGTIVQKKKLLPVKEGQLGLRQSDAVFHHTVQLPEMMEQLFDEVKIAPEAVGVSVSPRDIPGSYMPCFLAGASVARSLSASMNIKLHPFSHQSGHIMAALYSSNALELRHNKFIAFHLSGGTTEAVLVTPDEDLILEKKLIASSLDLKAGQAIDRVGVMLGLKFPAGKELEQLAMSAAKTYRIRPSMKGTDCSLSGIENQCKKLLEQGESKENIAFYCLSSVLAALDGMTSALLQEYGNLPLVYAGGVMSNKYIRRNIEEKYNAYFAQPEFSCDNASGIALLAAAREECL